MHTVCETRIIANVAKNLQQKTVHSCFGFSISIIGIANWNTNDEWQQTRCLCVAHHEIEPMAEDPRSPRPAEYGQQAIRLEHLWERQRKNRAVQGQQDYTIQVADEWPKGTRDQ